jgi:hypothetical protein
MLKIGIAWVSGCPDSSREKLTSRRSITARSTARRIAWSRIKLSTCVGASARLARDAYRPAVRARQRVPAQPHFGHETRAHRLLRRFQGPARRLLVARGPFLPQFPRGARAPLAPTTRLTSNSGSKWPSSSKIPFAGAPRSEFLQPASRVRDAGEYFKYSVRRARPGHIRAADARTWSRLLRRRLRRRRSALLSARPFALPQG